MDTHNDSFPERLALAVKKAGNAEKLAKAAGISRRVIGKYLSGETTDPSYKRVVAMANAAGVDIKWLMTGQGPMCTETMPHVAWDGLLIDEVMQAMETISQEYRLDLSCKQKSKLFKLIYTECWQDRQAVEATTRKFCELLR